MTSEGKLSVCNEICENLAKFKSIKNKKEYIDCLKFFQSNLSSGKNYLGSEPSSAVVLGAAGAAQVGGNENDPNSENREGADGNDLRVLRRVECMSPDFIR